MKSSNEKKMSIKKHASFVSLKQRIVALFTAAIMLLQICLPTIAWAASALSNESITASMSSPRFQKSLSNAYLYEQASFDDASYVGSQNITTFREKLVAAKTNLGKPTFIPISSDITIFVPTYPTGKLIGDAYVQNRYIRQQVFDLLGRHLIYANSSDISEVAQINKLYDAAFAFAKANPALNFGANLDAATIARISLDSGTDMIWPEIRVINNESVVVPILYLKTSTINDNKVTKTRTEFMGSVANLGSITLNHAELTVGAKTVVSTAGNLTATNNALISSGGDINLVVGGTLNLIGSSVTGEKNVTIFANEMNVKSVLVPFQDRYGSGTKLGSISSINSTTGNISLTSAGNVTFEASTAAASNGSLTINAGGNISILPLFASYQGQSTQNDWKVNSSSLDVIGSRLSAQDLLSLSAGGVINITASDLISTLGGIELLAGEGIHILDELEQTSIQKEDRKGKTKGTSSEFRTEAVRAILNAGKGVLLDSERGDVVLRATQLTSTSGTEVYARNGTVHLLMTKELEEFHLQTTRKGTWTIKTRTEDIVHENNIQNAIVGGLQVQAKYGVNVEYTGKEGATLKEQIEEYRSMPEMKWMADLYDQAVISGGQSVNWEVMEEVHKELKKTKRSLSPAAMAIIAIAVCVAMGPAGAGFLGSGTGAIGAATFNGAVMVNAAVMQAGALTLATQAAQSLASGNNLRETISAFDSNENLKSLAISMATAGAMQYAEIDMFTVAAESKNLAVSLSGQAAQAVVNSTVSAGISVAINGGNTKDFETAFVQGLAMSAVSKLGEKMANKIGDASKAGNINEVVKYLAHAGAGCVIGVASAAASGSSDDNKYTCYSGAGGAVIGEFIADQYKENVGIKDLEEAEYETRKWLEDNGLSTAMTDEQYNALTPAQQKELAALSPARFISASEFAHLKAKGVDIAKLGAGLAAFAAGADVSIAAQTGENAAENNAFHLVIIGAYYAYRAYQAYVFLEGVVNLGLQINAIVEGRASYPTEDAFIAAIEEAVIGYAGDKLTDQVLGGKKGKEILQMISDKMKATGAGKNIIDELDKVIDALDNKKYEADNNKNLVAEDSFEHYKNDLRKAMDKPVVNNQDLKNIMDDLYRPGAKIGSGSTADAVRYEKLTGQPVGDKFHTEKAENYVRALDDWLLRNPMSNSDRSAAENVLIDLKNALSGN